MKPVVTEFVVDGVRRMFGRSTRQARSDLRQVIVFALVVSAVTPYPLMAANAPAKASAGAAITIATPSVDPPSPPFGGPPGGGCGAPGSGQGVGGGSNGRTVVANSIAVPGQGGAGGSDCDQVCSTNPAGGPSGNGGGGSGWGPNGGWGINAGSGGGAVPIRTVQPIYLKYGAVYESVDDLLIATPMGAWNQARSYMSNGTGDTSIGNKWLTTTNENYLDQQGDDISLIVNAASAIKFTGSGSPLAYSAPAGNTLQLEHDSSAKRYIITDTMGTRYDVYNDFTVTNAEHRGKLIEQSSQGWNEQNLDGFEYNYDSAGKLTSIMTATGQDYTIEFAYSGDLITKVQVKDGSTVLQQVDYTYYGDVTSPSTDLGSTGDLVQVKVSKRASDGTLSITRYTQYRYDTESRLKAVYEHDAIQRIISELGVANEADLMKKDDDYGTPDVEVFANRRFTYYTADTSTSNITTPFTVSENLNSTYGGSETAEIGFVKSEILRSGCGSCGSSGGVTKTYFYLNIAQGAIDQNEVTQLIIEDTEDSDGNAHHRVVRGLNTTGKKLREVFIDDPTGSPTYWCESWKMATSGKPDRVAEYRKPSAHTIVDSASELRSFLDPYDSESNSWTNDTNTQNASDGYIEVHSYSTEGMKTDSKIKKGRTGTAYYTWAADYGDGDGDSAGDDHANKTMMIASYTYYDKSTTRADGKKTSYSYTFHDSDDTQIKTKTITLPVIPTSQNGSGVATTSVEYIDKRGRVRWTKNGEGHINYYSYHPESGGQAIVVVDIDPASPGSDVTNGSNGNWEAWTVGDANNNKPTRDTGLPTALALTTKSFYDEAGRIVRVAESGGANHYTVYEDNRTIQFPYWDSTHSTCSEPIQVVEQNNVGHISETFAVRADYTSITILSNAPTGFSTEPSQSDYVSWTRYAYNETTGQPSTEDHYHDIPSSGLGTLSTHFHRTISHTDAMGRPEYTVRVVSGSTATDRKEQVEQRVYDVRGRIIRTRMGVSGDSTANSHNMTDDYDTYPTMVTVSELEYDSNGIGDGYVTTTRRFHGDGPNDYTGLIHHISYRGHTRGIEPYYIDSSTATPIGPYTVTDVNWLGLVTCRAMFKTNPSWTTVLTGDGYTDYADTTSSGRGTLKNSAYDSLGRLMQTKTFAIDATTGAKGNAFHTDVFYDRLGQVVAVLPAHQSATEFAYDAAGRRFQTRVVSDLSTNKYSSGAFEYRDPNPVSSFSSTNTSAMSGGDDGVITLAHSVFDEAGNNTEQHTIEMTHDDTGSTLGIDLSSNDDYVRSTLYKWYDAAGHIIATANYGSGDTSTGAGEWKYTTVPARPVSAPASSASTVLMQHYSYDSKSSRMTTVTDPNGMETKSFFDDLGRKVWLCQNYDDFSPDTLSTISDASETSKDRVTKTEYDGSNNVTMLTAYNGSSSSKQETRYLREDSIDATRVTSTIYPDSTDTTSAGADQVKQAYDVDGLLTQVTDQGGTITIIAYDPNRRLQSRKITTLGTGVDGGVRSLTQRYDSLGRVDKATSHGDQVDDPDDTTDVVNQVTYSYDDLGRVTASKQSHSGTVDGNTPQVSYSYSTSAASAIFTDGSRLQSITYPDGRALYYDYGPSDALEDIRSHPKRLRETGATGDILVEYSHTGGLKAVITDYQQPDLMLDLFKGVTGIYAGLDRFGRVIEHGWHDYTSGVVDRTHNFIGYNYDSERSWIEDTVAAANSVNLDTQYTYDGLGRLTDSESGNLNSTRTSISTLSHANSFGIDQLGNWNTFSEDSDGDGISEFEQDRTHDDANQVSEIDLSATHVGYGDTGNMQKAPVPDDWSAHYTLTWDAWGRLVKIEDGSTIVATYEYDARNRRITKSLYSGGLLDATQHLYLSLHHQLLESRIDTSTDAERQFTWGLSHVDALVMRSRDTDNNTSLDEELYALHDSNWSVSAVADDTGAVVERFSYSPYGRTTVRDDDFNITTGNDSSYEWEYRFTSREFDEESALQNFRARYYHAELGRFLSRDPLGYWDGMNLFGAYFVPNATDPYGLGVGIANDPYVIVRACCTFKTPQGIHSEAIYHQWVTPQLRPGCGCQSIDDVVKDACEKRANGWFTDWTVVKASSNILGCKKAEPRPVPIHGFPPMIGPGPRGPRLVPGFNPKNPAVIPTPDGLPPSKMPPLRGPVVRPFTRPTIGRPGTRFNPDGTPKNPVDQLDQLRRAQRRGKLIECDGKSAQNVDNWLDDLENMSPDEIRNLFE